MGKFKERENQTMKLSTEETRDRAYSVLQSAGYEIADISSHGRILLDVRKPDGERFKALVKTGSIGQAMVRSKSGDADNASISGFAEDVRFVLFAMGDKEGHVVAYLVPVTEAEAAFRKAHREHNGAKDSTTWVIYFHGKGSQAANNYHRHWEKYRILPSSGEPIGPIASSRKSPEGRHQPSLTISEAKRLLAASLGVPLESVKITIEG